MTLAIDPVYAAALEAAGTENNPFVVRSLFASATMTTETGTELSPGDNVQDGATYNFWSATPNGSGFARLQFAYSGIRRPDFVGIAAHNLGDIGATVKWQYSTDGGSSWTDSPAGSVEPTDNRAIGFRWAPGAIEETHFRLVVEGVTDDVVVGVVLLGQALMFPRRIYGGYSPPLTPTEVELLTNVSEGGHLLGTSTVRRGSSATAAFSGVSPAFLRSADWLDFQRDFNNGAGFFWHWRPDKYADADLYYAWRQGAVLRPTNGGQRDLMDFEMSMRFFDEP